MKKKIDKAMEKLEGLLELGGIKKDIVLLVISGIALLLSIFDAAVFPFDAAWIAIVLCGIPIILEAVIGLVTEFDIKADVLVSFALVAAVCIGEDFAAGEVAFIMQLGALLEDLTVARARAGIERLVDLSPRTARVIENGNERIIPAEEVCAGDLIRVLPGETVPADGVITSGKTSIDQAVMTGESLPVDKAEGDDVSSGTVNRFGAFEMRAEKAGEDSSIQRMIRLVKSADAGKAKIVGTADRWAVWIVIIALLSAIVTWAVTGEIIRAVTILVVFCPCALVLATPTAIMAAIGNAAKRGFLVKEGDALERLAVVKKAAFDKTGTLTYGIPKVAAVKSTDGDITEKDIYKLTAAAEQLSEHPLGKAVVTCFKAEYKEELPKVSGFRMVPGRGVEATAFGRRMAAGNDALMAEIGAAIGDELKASAEKYLSEGCTVIYVSADSKTVGLIALSDTLREESAAMIAELKGTGTDPVLITGDNENAAREMASRAGISDIHSGCLPEDKLEIIDSYQKKNMPVCMVGDGINDAPALKKAAVGIAMGGVGSDIAVEAADIALANDKIEELPHLIALAKRMMVTIKCNLSFSMALNFIAIILAITGVLNPVVGALVHNAGSVIVIINSAFLLKWRKRKQRGGCRADFARQLFFCAEHRL